MVNGHKSAATDSLDGSTGKTYLGGGMHCPSAAAGSFNNVQFDLHMCSSETARTNSR